jgi:hypothetical protein
VLERRKKGFTAPLSKWFKAGLWEKARDRLVNSRCVRDGLIDPSFVDWHGRELHLAPLDRGVGAARARGVVPSLDRSQMR